MGVDAGDFDNDGDEDIFVTELTGQGSDLYVNDGSGIFEDASARSRLRFASLPYTGFGAAWFDVDNDGWLDLLGRQRRRDEHRRAGPRERSVSAAPAEAAVPQSRQRTVRGCVRASRRRVPRGPRSVAARRSATSTTTATPTSSSRNDNGPAELLINEIGNRRHWLGLRLVGGQRPRDMVGARVEIIRKDRAEPVAEGARRRELRVGQRSAGACGPGRLDGSPSRSCPLAGRSRRGMEYGADRSLFDADGGPREVKVAPLVALLPRWSSPPVVPRSPRRRRRGNRQRPIGARSVSSRCPISRGSHPRSRSSCATATRR